MEAGDKGKQTNPLLLMLCMGIRNNHVNGLHSTSQDCQNTGLITFDYAFLTHFYTDLPGKVSSNQL